MVVATLTTAGALDVQLTEDEIRTLEQPYTVRRAQRVLTTLAPPARD